MVLLDIENTNFQEGATLLIDKPENWTSFDVVKLIKKLTGAKTGHGGTLDPLATGLMIVCTGKNTKKLETFLGLSKTYTGTFFLGETTPSFDRETKANAQFDISNVNEVQIHEAAQSLTGKIMQSPPVYSALKKDGKRMFTRARKGEQIEMPEREVHIERFEIKSIELPYIHVEVKCSKGTYIRSLANDFGKKLKAGAFLYDLRRTGIGDFSIEDAWNLEALVQKMKEKRNRAN